MNILIKTVRVFGFRGLQNTEIDLDQTTVLTGMNNSGKTSFLKALQLALGSRQFLCHDDFFVSDNQTVDKIIIDLLIISVDDDGSRLGEFAEDWEILFTEDRIKTNVEGHSLVPMRCMITFDDIRSTYKASQFALQQWPDFVAENGLHWHQADSGKERPFHFDEIPFFYMNAQRDILEDIKTRTSYLGKMISKIEYSPADIEEIEKQIKELNEKTVTSSNILSSIKDTLKELNTAMDTDSEGIEITPFTKKIRDLNKGLSIYYTDSMESFAMDYHGMGTRSWSSLLTLKAFITLLDNNARQKGKPFFPVLAIEEPEAHLHPNAQKKLYQQIHSIKGQKIISTHSPYVGAAAQLGQIRNLYKEGSNVRCGHIPVAEMVDENIRKIKQQVINTRGEIFFSKALVLFEGETEEQALPILADHHFKMSTFEMGVNYISVGGQGNYSRFLQFATALNIPWFIFSDAEPRIKTSVEKQVMEIAPTKLPDCVVFLDAGNDYEKQLISDGYADVIKTAIIQLEIAECHNEQHRQAKEPEIRNEVASYNDTILYEIMTAAKAKYAPIIAEEIIKSKKPLPPKILTLFNKINALFTDRSMST